MTRRPRRCRRSKHGSTNAADTRAPTIAEAVARKIFVGLARKLRPEPAHRALPFDAAYVQCSVMRRSLVVVGVLLGTVVVHAEPAAVVPASTAPAPAVIATTPSSLPAPSRRQHLVYLDLFGKGGLWGVGYEWRHGRFVAGAAASFYVLSGDRYTTLAPYVGATPIAGERDAWFVHIGPQLVRHTTISPGPEWPGMTTTGYAVEASTGYEHRFGPVAARGYVMFAVGERAVPWFGASLGWAL